MFVVMLFFSGQAQAQELSGDILPPANLDLSQNESPQLAFPKMVFGKNNQYFNDVVTIQYQISLLKILIERQSQNVQIAESFRSIGLPYKEPAPSRSVCEEIPKNLLCVTFYPEIYGIEDIAPINTSKTEISLQDLINGRPNPAKRAPVIHGLKKEPAKTAPKKKQKPKKEDKKVEVFDPPYQWTEINCLKGTCRAKLINTNSKMVKLVYAGDMVPSSNDNEEIVVGDVQFNNIVLVNQKGETKAIRPAPSPTRGGPSSVILNLKKNAAVMDDGPDQQASVEVDDVESEELGFSDDEEVDVDELIQGLDMDDDEIEIVNP